MSCIILCSILLGLLELARPLIFLPPHALHLAAALSCYTDMFQQYFKRRDAFSGVVDRTVKLLISWREAGGPAASQVCPLVVVHHR